MGNGFSVFSHNRTYSAGSYIYSPSRIYFGVIETNGNFNVYRGESPDDPAKALTWSSNSADKLRPGSEVAITFFATDPQMRAATKWNPATKKMQIHGQGGSSRSAYYLWEMPVHGSSAVTPLMEAFVGDDGVFGLRQGTTLWSNDYSDPVVSYDIERCDYDRSQVNVKAQAADNTFEEVFTNKGSIEEAMTFAREVRTERTSSWSNTLGLTLSVSAKGGVDVPLLGKGELTVTTEFSEKYTFGGQTTKAETITISLPVVVPPGKKYRGYAIVRESDFTVPYTMTGTLHFNSGATQRRTIKGSFAGRNSYLAEGGVEDVTDRKVAVMAFVLHGSMLREAVMRSEQSGG